MENNNQPPQSMPPSTDPSDPGIWMSRSEYEKLIHDAGSGAAQNTGVRPVEGSAATPFISTIEQPAAQTSSPYSTASALFLALALFGAFAFEALNFTVPIVLGLFIIFAGIHLNDYLKARRGEPKTNRKGAYKAIMIISLLTLASPLLFVVGIIALMFVVCGFSGCRGS